MIIKSSLATIFFMLVILEQNTSFGQARYQVIELGVFATPSSINDSGQVVFYDGVQGTNVIWQDGATTSIGTLGWAMSMHFVLMTLEKSSESMMKEMVRLSFQVTG